MNIPEKLASWIPQVQGRYINEDWNPTNKGFGAQCWDLAANWSKFLGLPVIHTGGRGRWPGWAGNMVDAYPQTPAIAAAYELIGPDKPAKPGDIAVWGDSHWFYPATHVAVVVQNGPQLVTMSQNSTPSQKGNPFPEWSTGPTTLQHLTKQGLIGYLRPRSGINPQGNVTEQPKEWDEMASKEEFKQALREVAQEGPAGRDLGYFNWVETPIPGWNGSVSAAARLAGTDQTVSDIRAQLGGLQELVKQLSVKQGVVIDYAAIAKAVNDEEAKRMQK